MVFGKYISASRFGGHDYVTDLTAIAFPGGSCGRASIHPSNSRRFCMNIFGKYLLSITAVVAMSFAPAMAEQYSIKIGGGPTGGTFNTFSNAMSIYVPKAASNIQA